MTVLTDPQTHGVQPLLSGLSFAPRQRASTREQRERRRAQRRASLAAWARRNGDRVRTIVLTAVGLGSPTVAAFEWHTWVGLCALGVSALLLDVAVERGKKGGGDVAAR